MRLAVASVAVRSTILVSQQERGHEETVLVAAVDVPDGQGRSGEAVGQTVDVDGWMSDLSSSVSTDRGGASNTTRGQEFVRAADWTPAIAVAETALEAREAQAPATERPTTTSAADHDVGPTTTAWPATTTRPANKTVVLSASFEGVTINSLSRRNLESLFNQDFRYAANPGSFPADHYGDTFLAGTRRVGGSVSCSKFG